jgi:glycosyltransferase involved in cell wall biosynthesis
VKRLPLISVIVPVYKVEPYLARCIDSILAQTFTDFELILIDDGSPDNCGRICDEYSQKSNRIQVIHKENGGLSSARNAGIDWAFANSNSQWITFIDSDDWIHPQYLELLLSGANSTHTDICICEYTKTSKLSDFEKINNFNTQELTPEDLFVNHHATSVIACCKLYKKSCFENIRYPLGKLHEDEYTTYKILFEKSSISYLEEPLYFYFTNSNSIMNSEWSPKRLDAIGAFQEQIHFFENGEYIYASKLAKELLIWFLSTQIDAVKNSGSYNSYLSKLKKLLKNSIRKYKKELKLSIKVNSDIYRKSYPVLSRIYWLIVYTRKKASNFRR